MKLGLHGSFRIKKKTRRNVQLLKYANNQPKTWGEVSFSRLVSTLNWKMEGNGG